MSEIDWKQTRKDKEIPYQKGKLYKVRKYTKGSKQLTTAFNALECFKDHQEGYKVCSKKLHTIQAGDHLMFLSSVVKEHGGNRYVNYVFLHSEATVVISQKIAKRFVPVYGQRWQKNGLSR